MGSPAISAALAFVAREYPGQYQEEDVAKTVGTSSLLLLPSNPERMSLGIVNIGSTDIYISPMSDVSTSNGILLQADGGSYTCNVRDDLTLPTLPWYAVSSGAGGLVYAVDIYRFALTPTANPAVVGGG